MNHPHEDQLLLLAYGELPEAGAAEAEAHLAQCSTCRAQLDRLERARVALDAVAAIPAVSRRRAVPWIAAGLAAAAVVALVLFNRSEATGDPEGAWPPPAVWSTTAGYIAGGATVVQIDAQLTRLETERYYGFQD